ncbi:hypothetical protein ACF0H5_012953 [Mactra antiquata]
MFQVLKASYNKMKQFILTVCVTCMVLVGTDGSSGECENRLQQCFGRMNDLDQRIGRMEATQAISEGRQSAIATEMMREMNMTRQDTAAVKSVVNTLVEDNVKMHGEMRSLSDVGNDVMGLRKMVTGIKQEMTADLKGVQEQVEEVSRSMHQESEAQIKITALLSSQIKKSNQLLEEAEGRFREIEARLNNIENAGSSENGNGEQLRGMVSELTSRLDGFQDYYSKKIEGMEHDMNSRHLLN